MEVLIAATPHVATLACLHFISEERGHIGKSVTEVLSLGTTRRSYNLTYHASPEELYVNKNLKYSYSTAFQAIDYVIPKTDPSNVVFQNDYLKHFTTRVTTQIDISSKVSFPNVCCAASVF